MVSLMFQPVIVARMIPVLYRDRLDYQLIRGDDGDDAAPGIPVMFYGILTCWRSVSSTSSSRCGG